MLPMFRQQAFVVGGEGVEPKVVQELRHWRASIPTQPGKKCEKRKRFIFMDDSAVLDTMGYGMMGWERVGYDGI